MKILVFGSLNIDKVYSLPHLPQRGETLYSDNYEVHVGGKGLNQAVSLSRAGYQVYMAGCIGSDGSILIDYLNNNKINTDFIKQTTYCTGHAIIEVDPEGQNQMILYGGTNQIIDEAYCDMVISHFEAGDIIVLQYETSCVEYIAQKAHAKGIFVVFNPSPFVDKLINFDYSIIDLLILNESEGIAITKQHDTNGIVNSLYNKMKSGIVILTLGKDGSVYYSGDEITFCPAFSVNAIDTTGAGDTFTGYCIKAIFDNFTPIDVLKKSSAASALAVMKNGAAETIPTNAQVTEFLNKY